MNISTEQTSASISVIISGDMDAIGCNSMRAQLEALAAQHKCEVVILNLKEVAYLDSSGIGAIVFLFKRIQAAGGKLGIIGVSGQPRELLELLRIDKTISVQFGDQRRGAHHPSSLTSIIARNQPLGWSTLADLGSRTRTQKRDPISETTGNGLVNEAIKLAWRGSK